MREYRSGVLLGSPLDRSGFVIIIIITCDVPGLRGDGQARAGITFVCTTLSRFQRNPDFSATWARDGEAARAVGSVAAGTAGASPRVRLEKSARGAETQGCMRRRSTDAVPALYTRLNNKSQTLVAAATLKADAETFEQLTVARKLVAAATAEKAGSLGIWWSASTTRPRQPSWKTSSRRCARRRVRCRPSRAKPPPREDSQYPDPGPRRKTRPRPGACGGQRQQPRSLADGAAAQQARRRKLRGPAARRWRASDGWQYKRYSATGTRRKWVPAHFSPLHRATTMTARPSCACAIGRAHSRRRPTSAWSARESFSTRAAPTSNRSSRCSTCTATWRAARWRWAALLAISELGAAAGGRRLARHHREPHRADCLQVAGLIVTALNGKTIQTIHTDAEGRMALADTLVLRQPRKAATDHRLRDAHRRLHQCHHHPL